MDNPGPSGDSIRHVDPLLDYRGLGLHDRLTSGASPRYLYQSAEDSEKEDKRTYYLAPKAEVLQSRYKKRVDFVRDDTGIPIRYAYVEPEENPRLVQYYAVGCILPTLHDLDVITDDFKRVWVKLPKSDLVDLHTLLLAPVHLHSHISYDLKKNVWCEITDKTTLPRHEVMSAYGYNVQESMLRTLESYVEEDESSKQLLMASTTKGTDTNLQKLVQNFVQAFTEGVTNGVGRTAVWSFLDMLTTLTRKLKPNSGVYVQHTDISSTTTTHSFNIGTSRSVSTCSTSGEGSSSLTSPPTKRKKLNESVQSSTRRRTSGESDHPDCDMIVVSRDFQSGLGKYLFLVEVHSHGVSDFKCIRKVFEEMIFVLQAQSEVFGLIFGVNAIRLLHGIRHADGFIEIKGKPFSLYKGKYFDVSNFQKMTMDVFSCCTYGVLRIDV